MGIGIRALERLTRSVFLTNGLAPSSSFLVEILLIKEVIEEDCAVSIGTLPLKDTAVDDSATTTSCD